MLKTSVGEPNWSYRDLLSCTLAEIDDLLLRAANFRHPQEYIARARGAVGLWLRMTDEARDLADLQLLVDRVNSVANPVPVSGVPKTIG